MAAEVLTGQRYDTSIDLWSLGILIYFLVHGEYPFISFTEIMNSKIPISNSEFGPIISKILVRDPASRATAADLLLDTKYIEIYEDFIKETRIEEVVNLRTELRRLKNIIEDQSNLIGYYKEIIPHIDQLTGEKGRPNIMEKQMHDEFKSNHIEFICTYPSEIFSRFGNITKFISETKGSCLELSNDDCLVRSTRSWFNNSFIAINHPLNGRITLTLRSTHSNGYYNSRIDHFNPNKCRENDCYVHFTGINPNFGIFGGLN
ncbi:hypothetical protein RCL1_000551 [Eukaryota sp. TZLM3-RCL]